MSHTSPLGWQGRHSSTPKADERKPLLLWEVGSGSRVQQRHRTSNGPLPSLLSPLDLAHRLFDHSQKLARATIICVGILRDSAGFSVMSNLLHDLPNIGGYLTCLNMNNHHIISRASRYNAHSSTDNGGCPVQGTRENAQQFFIG